MATISLTAATTNFSTQAAKLPGISANYNLLDPLDSGGRVRCLWFDYVADEAKAAGEYLIFGKLPARCRPLAGMVYCDGAVATADLDVGPVPVSTLADDDIDHWGDGLDIATAGPNLLFQGALAANVGTLIEEETYVAGKLVTAGLAEGDVVNGYILYVEST